MIVGFVDEATQLKAERDRLRDLLREADAMLQEQEGRLKSGGLGYSRALRARIREAIGEGARHG